MHFNLAILLLVTLVWGTTFPLLKTVASTLSGIEISGIRFVLAAVCMAPFLRKVAWRTWVDGALLGALAWCPMCRRRLACNTFRPIAVLF